jgi:lambda family phage tail tape measure protein
MKQYIEDSQNGADAAKKIFGDLTKGMEDAFVNFAKTGKLSFKDLANSIIEDLLRIQIRKTLAGLFGGGDTGGGFFKSILGFASGGEVSANKPILVGESGPELFVPHSGGSIVPNNSVGNYGSGGTVVYNISAVDAPSFQALIARDPAFIHSVAQAGSRMYPSMAR